MSSVAPSDFLQRMTNLVLQDFAAQLHPYHMLGLQVNQMVTVQKGKTTRRKVGMKMCYLTSQQQGPGRAVEVD